MNKPIPPLDLLFYLMETHDNPKHVGALVIFQKPKNAAPKYMHDLVDRLRKVPVAEPFNCRPIFSMTDIPRWKPVADMEMEYHVRHSALPAPGSKKHLIEAIQRLHVGVLDRTRPGWICHVIEGLENDCFALYTRIHHAYIDGMSGVTRLYGSLHDTPEKKDVVPLWGERKVSTAKVKQSAPKSKTGLLDSLSEMVLDKVKVAGELNALLVDIGSQLLNFQEKNGHIPFCAPRTRMNSPVRSDLRSVGLLTLPLDRAKAVCKEARCTINDLVLTLVDASLHDYLKSHKETPKEPLVAMIPMSVRDEGDDTATTQIATLLIEMGYPKMKLKDRLFKVASSAASSKEDAKQLSREALMDFVLMIGGAFELFQRTGLEASVPPSYNVLVSNVPGAKSRNLYMAGAKLVASYPISTLTPGNNINITVLSHGNSLDFGLVADNHAIPDIELIEQAMEKNFNKLLQMFAEQQEMTKPARKTAVKKTKAKAGKKPVQS